MTDALFCDRVLRALPLNWRCRSCRQVGQAWTLRRPIVLIGPADAQLQVPARCACGAADEILVRMPVLLLALLLMRLRKQGQGGADAAVDELRVEPRPSLFMFRTEQQYRYLINQLLHDVAHSGVPLHGIQVLRPIGFTALCREPDTDTPPEERDRRAMGMTPEEWEEFRRRAGLGDVDPDPPTDRT